MSLLADWTNLTPGTPVAHNDPRFWAWRGEVARDEDGDWFMWCADGPLWPGAAFIFVSWTSGRVEQCWYHAEFLRRLG